MARPLFVRIAGALGAMALAIFFVGLIPFLSAEPSAGAASTARTPAVTVNRQFKGDRLPLPANFNFTQIESGSKARAQTPPDIPVGCDASFSPISTPRLAYIFGRCMT